MKDVKNPGIIYEPMDAVDTDWVVLNPSDEVSWTLSPRLVPKLEVGSVVRVAWKPAKDGPTGRLRVFGGQFPARLFVVQLVVEKD